MISLFFAGGQALVHPLQVEYIQGVIQARLTDCSNPLTEVIFGLICNFYCRFFVF